MIWTVLGWIVWGIVAYVVLIQWMIGFTSVDGGVRILARRCGLVLSIALVVTAVGYMHNLNLLWAAPTLFFGAMLFTGAQMQTNAERAFQAWRVSANRDQNL